MGAFAGVCAGVWSRRDARRFDQRVFHLLRRFGCFFLTDMNRDRIGPALGKITSGIYIVTTVHEGARVGMLASFLEQAAFEPPMLTVAVARGRAMSKALREGSSFGVNILGKQDHGLVRSFVKHQEGDPFAGHAMVENEHFTPQFAEAMAFLVCKVVRLIDAGDHHLYLAEVIDGVVQHDHEQPMSRIRRNGFDY